MIDNTVDPATTAPEPPSCTTNTAVIHLCDLPAGWYVLTRESNSEDYVYPMSDEEDAKTCAATQVRLRVGKWAEAFHVPEPGSIDRGIVFTEDDLIGMPYGKASNDL